MKWLLPLQESDQAQFRIVCFPFAGGGAHTFREWSEFLGTDIDVYSVLLPGRDLNFSSKLVRDCDIVTREICNAILGKNVKQTIFFGHSLGGLLAYNTALQMARYSSEIRPKALILSGCYPPHVLKDDDTDVRWKTDDDALIQKISKLGGLSTEVVESEELLEHVVRILRSDLFLADNARRVSLTRYKEFLPNIPIIAMGGDEDPKVKLKDLDLWEPYTRSHFARKSFSGGHFYLSDDVSVVCKSIRQTISTLIVPQQ